MCCVRGLHEEDMVYGLWKRSASKPDTRVALSLAQHGYWEKAQSMLHDKMKEAMEVTACCSCYSLSLTHSLLCASLRCSLSSSQACPRQSWECGRSSGSPARARWASGKC